MTVIFPKFLSECAVKQRGSTLLVTLIFLVLATILVIALCLSAELEQQASSSMAQEIQTELLMNSTIAHATALLAENIPALNRTAATASSATPTNWWVNPGMLHLQVGNGNVTEIPLYSGDPGAMGSINLNQNISTTSGSPLYPIEPSGAPLNVSWINVPRNPTQPASATNPIIGRYAFWIDDENCKLNYTAALGRASTLHVDPTSYALPVFAVRGFSSQLAPEFSGNTAAGHPLGVDLSVLPSADLLDYTKLYQNYVTENSGKEYNSAPTLSHSSAEDVVQFLNTTDPTSATTFFNANRFYLTNYNRSPEFNAFGSPRLFGNDLTANSLPNYAEPPRVQNTSYNYMLSADVPNGLAMGQMPTISNSSYQLDYSWFKSSWSALANRLNQPWPGYPNSFVSSWGSDATAEREADQVGLNIIAHSVSANVQYADDDFGGMLHGYEYLATSDFLPKLGGAVFIGPLTGGTFFPALRTPLVNEIALQVQAIPANAAVAPGGEGPFQIEFSSLIEQRVPQGYVRPGEVMKERNTQVAYLTYNRSINGGAATPVVATLGEDGQTVNAYENEPTSGLGFLRYYNINGSTTINPATSEYATGQSPTFATSAGEVDGNGNQFAYTDRNGTVPQIYNLHDTVAFTNIKIRVTTTGDFPASYYRFFQQICPLRSRTGTTNLTNGLIPAVTIDSEDAAHPALISLPDVTVVCDPTNPGYTPVVQSVEIDDPRLNFQADVWKPSTSATGNTFNARNSVLGTFPVSGSSGGDESRLEFLGPTYANNYPSQPLTEDYALQTPTLFASVVTGTQRSLPWQTVSLESGAGTPPSYLLLDLVAAWNRLQNLQASAGRLNVNTRIFPNTFTPAVSRGGLLLQAPFTNLQIGGADTNPASLARTIVTNEPPNGYASPLEICEDPQWAMGQTSQRGRETLAVQTLGHFTTQSNTFMVWGEVQTVKQITGTGLLIQTSSRRFKALIERHVWPGTDGIRGNGTFSGGTYSKAGGWDEERTSNLGGAFPGDPGDAVDGPDAPTLVRKDNPNPPVSYTPSTLDSAVNPVLPYMKYSTIYFDYLDNN